MAKRKKKRSNRKAAANRWKVMAAAFFLLVFLVGTLSLLSWLRDQARPPKVDPPVKPPVARSLPTEDVRVELESLFLRTGVSLDRLTTQRKGEVRTYNVEGVFPESALIEIFSRRLERLDTTFEVSSVPSAKRLLIRWDGSTRYRIDFVPPVLDQPDRGPRVAIIMDDIGHSMHPVRQVIALNLQITGAILPERTYAKKAAQMLHRNNREVLIHIPMQPKQYPEINPGAHALLVGQNQEEIQKRLKMILDQVPHAVGGNNHMGSRLTEDRRSMALVMKALQKRGLFFIDSMTSARSVGLAEARRAGVPTIGRDIFLDNNQNVTAIRKQLRKLIRLARERGQAVGICHPYPETLEALRLEVDAFRQMGVEVVPVSELLS